MIKTLKVKDILNKDTQEQLEELGFQYVEDFWPKDNMFGLGSDFLGSDFYCWFDGKKRKGYISPTIMINKINGVIFFYMTQSYYYRNIPSVLLEMFKRNMIEEI